MKTIDLDTWARREHFEFFRSFELPFFNICAELDVTALHELCSRDGGPSFFVASIFLSQRAVNDVEEFRYRIRGDVVVEHDTVDAGSTVLLPDDSFAFAYFEYRADFSDFERHARHVLARRKRLRGMHPEPERDDLIHYSVIPWIAFTSFKHARKLGLDDSIPKIVLGKHHASGDRRVMPISVEVHHSLMDGLHLGRYLGRFQEYLDRSRSVCGLAP